LQIVVLLGKNLIASHATDQPTKPVCTLQRLEKMALRLYRRLNHCLPCFPKHLLGGFRNDLASKTIFLLIQEHLEVSVSAQAILIEPFDGLVENRAIKVFGAVGLR